MRFVPPRIGDPVHLSGRELGESADVDALRTAALAYARANLQGRVAWNAHTGWAIAVGRRGINKTLNHGARREHLQSVPALLALIERGTLVFSEANRDAEESRNVPRVHTLIADLVLGTGGAAVTYRVRLIVRETNEGYRFYDHDLSVPPLPN